MKWLTDRRLFSTLIAFEEETGSSLHPFSENLSVIRNLCISGKCEQLLEIISDAVPASHDLHACIVKQSLMEQLSVVQHKSDVDAFLDLLEKFKDRLSHSDIEHFVALIASGGGRGSSLPKDWNLYRSRYELFETILRVLSPFFPFDIHPTPAVDAGRHPDPRPGHPSAVHIPVYSDVVKSEIVGEYRDESSQPIRCVSFSRDGSRLAIGTNSQSLVLCESKSLRPIARSHHVHAGSVYTCAWSGDDHWIATGSNDQTVRTTSLSQLQGLAVGSQGNRFQLHVGTVRSLCYTLHGEIVVGCSGDAVARLLDAHTGTVIGRFQCGLDGHVTTVDSCDSLVTVATSCGLIRSFDRRASESPVWQRPLGVCESCVAAVASHHVAVGSESGAVSLWDTRQNVVAVWSEDRMHSGPVRAVDFDPAAKRIASASFDRLVKVSAVSSGRCVSGLTGHTDRVVGVSWRNSPLLASCGTDARVLLWSVPVC